MKPETAEWVAKAEGDLATARREFGVIESACKITSTYKSQVNKMPTIAIDKYPQLSTLCWNRIVRTAEESEVLSIYEAGWRFVDKELLTSDELDLINRLAQQYGNGVLNV